MKNSDERERKLNEVLATLSSAIISPTITFDQMYQLVLDNARFLTDSEHGFVSSIDQDTTAHVSNTLTKMRDQGCSVDATFSSLPEGPHKEYKNLWGHSLNVRAPFFTNAPSSHPASQGLPSGHIPINNFLSVPVMFGGKLLGQIALANSSHDYTEHDLSMIRRLGEFYAIVIHNRQREMELKRSEECFRSMVEAAPFPLAVVRMSDHTIIYINAYTAEFLGFPIQETIGRKTEDFFEYPKQRAEIIAEVNERGFVSNKEINLRDNYGRRFWVLLSAVKIKWFGEEVLMISLNDVTDRKRIEEELKRLATIDYLTGIWNRRHFMELGNKEYVRFARYNHPFSVLIFDLDKFKQVNDTYGHSMGDVVLQQITKAISDRLRAVDIFGRYGGEEFAIILPETVYAKAAVAAEALRMSIAETKCSVAGSCETICITASFGLAEAGAGDDSFECIIDRADHALLKAKSLGRNKLVIA